MQITRTSPISGEDNTREIDVDEAIFRLWDNCTTLDRPLLHHTFPDLSAADREFILTGITPEEWDKNFGRWEESNSKCLECGNHADDCECGP